MRRHPLTSKPYRKGYWDIATTETMLLLVGLDYSPFDVRAWTPEQLAEAGNWALRSYLRASDNDTVRVPAKPSFLPDYRPLNPDARTVMDL